MTKTTETNEFFKGKSPKGFDVLLVKVAKEFTVDGYSNDYFLIEPGNFIQQIDSCSFDRWLSFDYYNFQKVKLVTN